MTRTFHYGNPTDDMIQRYTEVLQGSVELARLVLPDKTQVLARRIKGGDDKISTVSK